MKKSSSVSLEESDWNSLEVKAQELQLGSKNQVLQKIVHDFLHGDDSLSITSTKELLEEKKIQKLEIDIQEKIENRPLKKRKLEAETTILEYHADNLPTIGSHPSRQAKAAIKQFVVKNGISQVQVRDPIPNFWIEKINNFKYKSHCKLCSIIFDDCQNYQEALGDMEYHLEAAHSKQLYQENYSI